MPKSLDCCNTKKGRPHKVGRSVYIPLRLREGEDDEVLMRLARLPTGQRSAYIRRVLAGAPVEALEVALQETARAASILDSLGTMWEED